MARNRIAEMATAGRQTAAAGRASETAQACIDAFFDGDSAVFSVGVPDEVRCRGFESVESDLFDVDDAPESGATGVMPLAPAA